MTSLGALALLVATVLTVLWVLDLVRRGRLYVGYGIVLLVLLGSVAGVTTLAPVRRFVGLGLDALYPAEPLAVVGISAVVLLLIYVLHQLSILSDRVARLTQEIALRNSRDKGPGDL